jgi:predicted PurR-regulated permease PerM
MSFHPPSRHQTHLYWTALSGLAIAVLVALVVVLVWGLGRVLDILSPVLWPLAVAGVIAYLLDPVVDYFERRGLSRARAIVSVFAIAIIIVAGALVNVVPPIVNQTREFAKRIPEIRAKVEQRVEKWADNPPAWFDKIFKSGAQSPEAAAPADSTNSAPDLSETSSAALPPNASRAPLTGALNKTTIESATGWLAGFLPKASSWVFSWFGVLVGLALVPIYAFYLLLEKQGIQSKWTNYLPVKDSAFKDELVFILQAINDYLIAFFRGQVLVAICDGILYGVGFLLIGVPYAILLGAAAMVLTIVPFIGAVIIFVTAMIISLVQFGDWKHPLLVVAVFAIVQTLEGVVISPRIMKGRVGLHPLTIIIAVMVGTTLLGGLLGGVLAIPLTAVLRVLMARYVWKRPAAKEGL